MPKELDVMGHRFGRLIAIRKITPPGTRSKWECRCDCGAITIAALSHLRGGQTRSCGCLRREVSVALFTRIGRQKRRQARQTRPRALQPQTLPYLWELVRDQNTLPQPQRHGLREVRAGVESNSASAGSSSRTSWPTWARHRGRATKSTARTRRAAMNRATAEWLTKGAHSTLHGKERAARGELGQGPRDPVTGRFTRGA